MLRSAAILAFACVGSTAALAQPFPAEGSLNPAQRLGRDLFTQHCMVCHEHTQITLAAHFGPDISAQSLGGKDSALMQQISNGSPNMPGFKYLFDPQQISAIVSYVKLLQAPVREVPRDQKPSQGERHDD